MQMPGRKYSVGSGGYRYSFNGQEKEKELNENITSAEFWMYDSRIVRRWNVDPVLKEYESPYMAFSANPIWLSDHNGADTMKAAGGGNIYIGNKASGIETYDGSGSVVKGTTTDVPVEAGQVRKFDLNGKTYQAKWTVDSYGYAIPAGYETTTGEKYNEYAAQESDIASGLSEWDRVLRYHIPFKGFEIYQSTQLRATLQEGNTRMVVPLAGYQIGASTWNGGYINRLTPLNTYYSYGLNGIVEGRIMPGQANYAQGEYMPMRGLATIYPGKGFNLQLDVGGGTNLATTPVYVGLRITSSQDITPNLSTETNVGVRTRFNENYQDKGAWKPIIPMRWAFSIFSLFK
jgi:hypothetical protein